MDNRENEEIQNALNEQFEDMEFEEIPETAVSPINEPVGSGQISASKVEPNSTIHEEADLTELPANDGEVAGDEMHFDDIPELDQNNLDAPEQDVNLSEEEALRTRTSSHYRSKNS